MKQKSMSLFPTFFPAVVLLLLLASCSKEGNSDSDLPSGRDVPIGFSSSVSSLPEVRGTGAVVTDIDKMYVFASYTGTSHWQTSCLPNFMYKQLMSKESSSGSWNYSPVKYWPNNNNDQISFFAFAPADLTGVTVSASNVAGPKITYRVPLKEEEGQDLLMGADMNKKKTDGTVVFQMNHVLSQIKFIVKSGDSGTTKIVKGLTVHASGTGTASFTADGKVSWAIDTAGIPSSFVAEKSFTGGITVPVPDDMNSKTDVIAAFFLLPVGDASPFTVSLTYTLQKAGESSAIELTATSYFPASPQWLPGSHIAYTLTLVDDRLEIEKITVENYGDGTPAGNEIPAT